MTGEILGLDGIFTREAHGLQRGGAGTARCVIAYGKARRPHEIEGWQLDPLRSCRMRSCAITA